MLVGITQHKVQFANIPQHLLPSTAEKEKCNALQKPPDPVHLKRKMRLKPLAQSHEP